jgi:hypothetical protein
MASQLVSGDANGWNNPAFVSATYAWGRDEIFTVNQNADVVALYERTAVGNAPPVRRLQGPATNLVAPYAIIVDSAHDELLVSNYFGNSITVYPRTARSDTPPIRSLVGGATQLDHPTDLVVDNAHDELLVANEAGSVTAYSCSSERRRRRAAGK